MTNSSNELKVSIPDDNQPDIVTTPTGSPLRSLVLTTESGNHYLIAPENSPFEGANSRVFQAFQLKSKKLKIKKPVGLKIYNPNDWTVMPKTFAVKIFRSSMNYYSQEYEISKQIQFTEKPVANTVDHYNETSHYMVTQFIPGVPLRDEDSSLLGNNVENLTLKQRTQLILDILRDVRRAHDLNIIHCDIKPQNINIHIDANTKDARAKLLDWGNATWVTDKAAIFHPFYGQNGHLKANMSFSPFETTLFQFGVKTDIYMLVNVIAYILGQPAPDQLKYAKSKEKPGANVSRAETASKEKFKLDELIKFPEIENANINLNKMVENFLERMQAEVYDERPAIDEVYSFFLSLHTVVKQLELNREEKNDKPDITLPLSYLHLINNNHWNTPISQIKLVNNPNVIKPTKVTLPTYPAKYIDFPSSGLTRIAYLDGKEKIFSTLIKTRGTFLLIDALKSRDWFKASQLLLGMKKSDIDDQSLMPFIKETINNNRAVLVRATINALKEQKLDDRKISINELKSGKSLLGEILKKPRNSFLYFFSHKKHEGEKYTGSVIAILNHFQENSSANNRPRKYS